MYCNSHTVRAAVNGLCNGPDAKQGPQPARLQWPIIGSTRCTCQPRFNVGPQPISLLPMVCAELLCAVDAGTQHNVTEHSRFNQVALTACSWCNSTCPPVGCEACWTWHAHPLLLHASVVGVNRTCCGGWLAQVINVV